MISMDSNALDGRMYREWSIEGAIYVNEGYGSSDFFLDTITVSV